MLSRVLTRKEQAVLLAVAAALLTGSAAVFWRGADAPPPAPQTPAALAATPLIPTPAPRTPPPSPAGVQTEGPAAAPAVGAAPTTMPEAAVTVQVRGAVRRPGVFAFPLGSRVEDALLRAGGVTDEGDLDDINLAAPLMDRAALTIPRRARRETVDETLVIRPGEQARDLNPAAYTLSGSRNGAVAAAAPVPGAVQGVAAAAPSGLIDLNGATQEQLETLPGIGPKLAADIIAHRESSPFQRPDDLMNVSGIGPKRYDAVKGLVTVSVR